MIRHAAVVYDSLSPFSLGGGERVYGRLAELLVDRGFQTDYVTRSVWEGEPPAAPFRVVGVWRGDIYDAHGVRTSVGALAFALHVWLHFVRQRRRYELVVASALPVLTVLAVRAALFGSRTRVVADWLEVWPAAKWREYSGPVAGTMAFVLQWAAAHFVREHSADSRFTAERLDQVRSGTSAVVLGLLDLVEVGYPEDAATPPFVLFIGRLIVDKGAVAVPEAVAIARTTVPNLRAYIVGDGPERQKLVVEVTRWDLTGVVDVLGRVSDEVLDGLRAGAAVLVAPSIREGFGLAVAEASAWGVPVVVVAHPDNAAVDLVDDGVNGFVVEPGNPAALAAGIVEAIHGGSALRRSTAEWFVRARIERGLSASLDQILQH